MKPFLYGAILACLLLSCHPQHPAVYSQGVLVDYDEAGRGDTTLLFAPGWCINKQYWQDQLQHFSQRYRVVAVTLPGFGASGKTRKDYTTQAYGEDLQAVITQLQLKNVVLIGHSMSGNVIVEAASQNGKPIIGLVGIDNFKETADSSSPATDSAQAAFYARARANYTGTAGMFAQYLFSAQTDTAIRKRVMDDILHANPVIAVNALEAGDRYPGLQKLAALHRRIYLLNSDYTPTDTAGLRRHGITVTLLPIHGTGHYPMIEAPAAFNAQLQAALDDLGAAAKQ